LDDTLKILEEVIDNKKSKLMKLMFFYHMNNRDEINKETKLLKEEVRSGLTDPVRTVATIEMQN
jgi:hypothetical protein